MRTLLLDRDGVINRDTHSFIRCVADWQALPGSLAAIVRAQRAGFRVVVISNQSGLARGLFGISDLHAVHRRLEDDLERIGGRIDAFFFCPHAPDDDCSCRKPGPGLLLEVQRRLGIELQDTPFIGDRLSDMQAARSAGARPILVRSGIHGLADDLGEVEIYDNLAAAVQALL
jgi:D-glycero-D-manno-heptose 1,7-bisphosphate phosphatase